VTEHGPATYLRWWLKTVLLSDCGWLRWKLQERGDYGYGPPEYHTVAPPLRRLGATLHDWRHGYFERPTAWSYLYDEDRTGDLQNVAPWRRFGPLQGWFE
jgi:hypothetical protein